MRAFLFAVIWLFASSSMASIEVHTFQTPQQEALYNEMIAELRCLVCQNQNLADSNSALAQDLRGKTYELVMAGSSRDAIIDFMVTRYGDFVLYKPPVKQSTLLLWLGPLLFFLVGLGVLFAFLRGKTRQTSEPLSDADHQRAAQLLAKDKP
ncbi:cytochrome c-type biogenesis protein [Thiothrix fructosivorans]|uniref:Cytochrome c-type biogenesis protein n=1 Tax=Thiothrix fructosivorans TaxID=111770 RepID=A0A8B0SG12_9GAMM|nr:cytochrome c-type biogenesis protein [Thiothrix fructosivorans]MBO0615324.1 cytochrome c-type biogenesis protein CcmH [Thiothrix fructosivorans]QTX10101.1 cytochrome c-type biogenesis protein CcmH [Thiothrix fructosivorans]